MRRLLHTSYNLLSEFMRRISVYGDEKKVGGLTSPIGVSQL